MGQLVAAVAAAFLAFWPQGGVMGRDLYLANSVDLDPAAGSTLDPWCGHRTYDGHTGEDVIIRSFREIDLGVPVFSATDGEVLEVQDGEFEYHYGSHVSPYDNHVIVLAPDGRRFIYGHLRKHIALRRGDQVKEGQQIGWTASSGNSSWPHLHLTQFVTDAPRDLFAGPCRPGGDDFAPAFAPFQQAPYVRNAVVSAHPFAGKAQLPWDEAARTGTFVAGKRDLWLRVELGEYAGGNVRIQLLRPDGSAALDDGSPSATTDGLSGSHGLAAFDYHERVAFDRTGAWRLRWSLDGTVLLDAPLRVVASTKAVANRAPLPFTVSVGASTADRPALCTVGGPLAVRDPDYDIVRYRYRWSSGGTTLRTVTSAGLADELVRSAAKPGQTLVCTVTAADGRATARPVSASARLG